MTFRLAIAQTCHPANGNVISLVRETAMRAAESNVDILAFPESLMTRFEEDRNAFIDDAQSIDGPFSTAVDEIAREHGLWIVYTMNEANPEGSLPFNTAIITGSDGIKHGVYRKVHLFDSSAVRESSRMSPGRLLFDPIESPFGMLGVAICYDLRFPELARYQTLKGCQTLLYPAAWVDGPNKAMQWKALLRARAIEDEIFVAGICRADRGYVGESFVFAPDGTVIAQTRPHEQDLVIADVNMERLEEARGKIPSLDHIRRDLY